MMGLNKDNPHNSHVADGGLAYLFLINKIETCSLETPFPQMRLSVALTWTKSMCYQIYRVHSQAI